MKNINTIFFNRKKTKLFYSEMKKHEEPESILAALQELVGLSLNSWEQWVG